MSQQQCGTRLFRSRSLFKCQYLLKAIEDVKSSPFLHILKYTNWSVVKNAVDPYLVTLIRLCFNQPCSSWYWNNKLSHNFKIYIFTMSNSIILHFQLGYVIADLSTALYQLHIFVPLPFKMSQQQCCTRLFRSRSLFKCQYLLKAIEDAKSFHLSPHFNIPTGL
jgi:hypothetical protein